MSKQGYFKDYFLMSLLIQISEIRIEFCKTPLFSQSQVQKQPLFMWFYAISDREVITNRNAPSNVLQNKNHHCTGFAIKRKRDFNLFQQLPVQMQRHRCLEFWDTEYPAADWLWKWRWNQNKSHLHSVQCFEGWHLWTAHVWGCTVQHPSEQWCWSRDPSPHMHTPTVPSVQRPRPRGQSRTGAPCSLSDHIWNSLGRFYGQPLLCTAIHSILKLEQSFLLPFKFFISTDITKLLK